MTRRRKIDKSLLAHPVASKHRDRKHLDWLRSLPCLKCVQEFQIDLNGHFENDPAHIRIGSRTGIAEKPDDKRAVPCCQSHHREQHQRGELTFWGSLLPAALRTASSLHRHTGDSAYALSIIRTWTTT
jgi:hypothetical protein